MIADWLNRRGIDTMHVFLAGAALSFSMVLLLALGVTQGLAVILAVQSFAGATTLLSYAVLARHFPAQLAGRFNTAANLMAFAAAFALHRIAAGAFDLVSNLGRHHVANPALGR